MSNELIRYIEQNIDKLLISDDTDIVTDDLIKSVIIENMELKSYRKFVSKFKVDEFTTIFSEFTDEQMKIMFECNYFELTPERFTEIRGSHPNLSIEFLLKEKETLLADLDNYK